MNSDFTASKPGEKMVGDITYIDTWEGWVYLATVIDCATRKIVGWAMDDNYKTPLISSAIEMAARNLDLRRVPYSTPTWQQLSSLSSKTQGTRRQAIRRADGICYDNALSESVNGTLKNELVYRTAYRSRKAAWMILRGGSSSAIIGLVSTPRSGIGHHRKFWTST